MFCRVLPKSVGASLKWTFYLPQIFLLLSWIGIVLLFLYSWSANIDWGGIGLSGVQHRKFLSFLGNTLAFAKYWSWRKWWHFCMLEDLLDRLHVAGCDARIVHRFFHLRSNWWRVGSRTPLAFDHSRHSGHYPLLFGLCWHARCFLIYQFEIWNGCDKGYRLFCFMIAVEYLGGESMIRQRSFVEINRDEISADFSRIFSNEEADVFNVWDRNGSWNPKINRLR